MVLKSRSRSGEVPDWSAIPDPWSAQVPDVAGGPDEASGASRPFATRDVALTSTRRGPTRPAAHRRQLGALALLVLWTAVMLALLRVRAGWSHVASFVALQGALVALAAALAGAAAIAGGRRGVGAPSSRLAAVVALIPIGFALTSLVWTAPGSPAWMIGPPSTLVPCLLLGIAVAAPPLLVASWALSRAFVSRSALRGAALGAAAGLVGAFVLLVHCGRGEGGHVAAAHGLPVLIAAASGALLGRRLMRA